MNNTIVRYVVGFMFSADLCQVALIRKQKPKWQQGKLNGIGGKIEPGESSTDAMTREFKEETGCTTTPEQWTKFVEIKDNATFVVDVYASFGDLSKLTTIEQEQIEVTNTTELRSFRPDMVENLTWLVALAVDYLNDRRPVFVYAVYPAAHTE